MQVISHLELFIHCHAVVYKSALVICADKKAFRDHAPPKAFRTLACEPFLLFCCATWAPLRAFSTSACEPFLFFCCATWAPLRAFNTSASEPFLFFCCATWAPLRAFNTPC